MPNPRSSSCGLFHARLHSVANKRFPGESFEAIQGTKSRVANRKKGKHLCLRLTKCLFCDTHGSVLGHTVPTVRPRSLMARRALLPVSLLRLHPTNSNLCNHHCKFAPLFSTTSRMLPPQPLSFQAFALLPGGGMGRLPIFFKYYFKSSFFHRSLAHLLSTLLPLCFQQLPTIKFCNSSVLITIRIAGGGYSLLVASPSQHGNERPAATTSSIHGTRSATPEFRVSYFEFRVSVSEPIC